MNSATISPTPLYTYCLTLWIQKKKSREFLFFFQGNSSSLSLLISSGSPFPSSLYRRESLCITQTTDSNDYLLPEIKILSTGVPSRDGLCGRGGEGEMITLLVILLSWNGAEDTKNKSNPKNIHPWKKKKRPGVSCWLGGRLHFPLGSNGERDDCLAMEGEKPRSRWNNTGRYVCSIENNSSPRSPPYDPRDSMIDLTLHRQLSVHVSPPSWAHQQGLTPK